MKLTTRQVAEKLDISGSAVRTLRDSGKLTDVAKRAEGKTKHLSLFESSQVNDYLKEFGKGAGRRRSKTVSQVSTSGPAILTRIDSRLSNVEEMLSSLLKMWS